MKMTLIRYIYVLDRKVVFFQFIDSKKFLQKFDQSGTIILKSFLYVFFLVHSLHYCGKKGHTKTIHIYNQNIHKHS